MKIAIKRTKLRKNRNNIQSADRENINKNKKNENLTMSSPPGVLQASLEVGPHGDIYEQEADRVAEHVMRMAEPAFHETREKQTVRPEKIAALTTTKTASKKTGATLETTPETESRINQMKGKGQPLTESDRAFFEPRFGVDFSQVHLHRDAGAGELASGLGARAFTLGKDIWLGKGETTANRNLIAHELTHVVQQQGQIRREEVLDYYSEPTGETDPKALIPVEDFIEYVDDVEDEYSDDEPAEIVTRLRLLYYNGILFDQLLPNAIRTEVNWNYFPILIMEQSTVKEEDVGEEAYSHLTARADENAVGDNPSPYIELENGEKIDVGHMLLGMDALLHPGSGEPYTTYDVPTLDPTTWVADIGVASVWMTYHEEEGEPDTRAPRELDEPDIDEYYEMSAPIEDLLGDVDTFGVYHLMEPDLDQSLSSVLNAYYIGTEEQTAGVEKRFQLFCAAEGLTYSTSGNKITWDDGVRDTVIDRVNIFSDLYGAESTGAAWGVIAGPTRRDWPYTETVVDKFLDWVKNNLEAELSGNK